MPETQHNGQAGPGYGRRVKIRYSRQINRCVVSTRELATIIAHSHPNLTQAVRRLLDKRPELVGEFLVGQYVAANRQRYTCYEVAAGGLAGLAERLHNVPGCNDVRARLDNIRVGLMVMDEQMARGEPGPEEVSPDAEAMTLPAPDSEIRPPEPEPAETLQPVEQAAAETEPQSWEINAAIATLRKSRLPWEIYSSLDRWNMERCEALAAWIYATKAPH